MPYMIPQRLYVNQVMGFEFFPESRRVDRNDFSETFWIDPLSSYSDPSPKEIRTLSVIKAIAFTFIKIILENQLQAYLDRVIPLNNKLNLETFNKKGYLAIKVNDYIFAKSNEDIQQGSALLHPSLEKEREQLLLLAQYINKIEDLIKYFFKIAENHHKQSNKPLRPMDCFPPIFLKALCPFIQKHQKSYFLSMPIPVVPLDTESLWFEPREEGDPASIFWKDFEKNFLRNLLGYLLIWQ